MSIDLQGPRAALFGLSGDLEMFRTVTLAETVERADLSKRTDRKYLVDLETVRQLMSGLTETHQVLEIDGRRTTTYSTTYFDTHDRYGTLVDSDLRFVSDSLGSSHPEVDVGALRPTAEITYTRACLVDVDAGTRVTIDRHLSSVLNEGHAWIDEGFAIVETKGGTSPGEADRRLLHSGVRPRSFSKYVATASLLHPLLPDNDIRSLQGTYLHRLAS